MTGLREPANEPNRESDEEEPVRRFQRKLSRSGSGGGVSLHFDADFAAEYELDPDTEVDVQVIEEDGDIAFKIGDIPAGFTYEDLKAFADDHGWEETDKYVDSNEWYLTYRNGNGNVRIEIDSETRINGSVMNNVVIQSIPIEISGDLELYNRMCAVASRKDIRIRINDSQGLWQRLQGSADHDTDAAPDEETFMQLSDVSEEITAQLVCQRSSLNTSLEVLREKVEEMEEVYETLDN